MGHSSGHANNNCDCSQPQHDTNHDTNTVYKILSSQRRRHAIQIIDEHGPLSRRDLSARLAAREHQKPLTEVTRDDRQSAYVTLIQHHIPKLVDAEIIQYDQQEDTLTPTTKSSHYTNVIQSVDKLSLSDDSTSTGAVENIVNWVIGR